MISLPSHSFLLRYNIWPLSLSSLFFLGSYSAQEVSTLASLQTENHSREDTRVHSWHRKLGVMTSSYSFEGSSLWIWAVQSKKPFPTLHRGCILGCGRYNWDNMAQPLYLAPRFAWEIWGRYFHGIGEQVHLSSQSTKNGHGRRPQTAPSSHWPKDRATCDYSQLCQHHQTEFAQDFSDRTVWAHKNLHLH